MDDIPFHTAHWLNTDRPLTLEDFPSRVLAVEVLTASRGLQLRAPLTPAPATGAVVEALLAADASRPGTDRWLAPEIDTAYRLVVDGTVRAAAEAHTGPLN